MWNYFLVKQNTCGKYNKGKLSIHSAYLRTKKDLINFIPAIYKIKKYKIKKFRMLSREPFLYHCI